MPQISARGLAPKHAAKYLGISEQTLRKQRSTGSQQGRMPLVPFARAGRRIIYLVEALDHWLEARSASESRAEPRREDGQHAQAAPESMPGVPPRGAK